MENKKGLNTNGNGYILVYSAVLVVVVAFLLAFVYAVLKPKSDANVEMDKKHQILAALNIRGLENDQIADKYAAVIVKDEVIDVNGKVIKDGSSKDKDGFMVDRSDTTNLPVYICKVDGATKYVVPLSGKGLWGPIWGYIAINEDKQTVYGAYFNHESETAGLGALIVEDKFQLEFNGKQLRTSDGKFVGVVKNGTVKDARTQCDGISGATKTSVGVNNMLQDCLKRYKAFLNTK